MVTKRGKKNILLGLSLTGIEKSIPWGSGNFERTRRQREKRTVGCNLFIIDLREFRNP